ncbi:2-oxo acid dehydrogenase subunit E2 [Streptomyces sp. F63]|uniref:dihydrolipoamide acetyltransferase family protein n=1 Tax=Streptomyces sp. F63 TaxID=2824887 RepID=UPI001B38F4E5|nr:dihydrolipoamide acetyltransferase family protein [Streptomyces sp. F63]MBQ0983167.1 2-oxo acid dehydrogenase subunit E2 [Streptomyces sp. F63]
MAAVREFALPDLGEGLTEAEIVRWLVEVGDVVSVDQPVVEVETAKAMVEVPCPYAGVVTGRFGEEGTELPVGAALLTVAVGAASAAEGAAAGSGGPGPEDSRPPAAAVDGAAGEGSGNVLVGYGTGAPPARRRRVRPTGLGGRGTAGAGRAPAAPGDARSRNGSRAGAGSGRVGPGGAGFREPGVEIGPGTTAGPGPAAAPGSGASAAPGTVRAGGADGAPPGTERRDGPVAVISPLVRRLARQNGLDLRQLTGSGPEGLILRADVESAVRRAAERPGPAAPATGPEAPVSAAGRTAAADAPGRGDTGGPTGTARSSAAPTGTPPTAVAAAGRGLRSERIPLRGVRGAVADKLSRSRSEIPDATTWVDADATELLAARAAMNTPGRPKVSLPALLARICTAALAEYPELNSTVDTAAREVVRLPAVHLGFAAQTDRGLMVPVIRDAHTLGAAALSEEFARLTEAARAGRLTPAELTGGTFTLNNYGVFGVDGSTPIINHPEAAMLGVGRIAPKPWVHRGELAVRQVVQLSFTFDHRVCDGGTAGGFLRYVADCIEQPALLLRTL